LSATSPDSWVARAFVPTEQVVDRVAAPADLGQQQPAVGDELAELLVALGEDAGDRVGADEQRAQLGVAVGHGLRQPGQAGERGLHARRGVGERLRERGERGRQLRGVDLLQGAGQPGDGLHDVER
jgi:hypothetical protein